MRILFDKSFILLVLLAAFFAACDAVLDNPPTGSLNEEVLSNRSGIDALLVGAYAALDGQSMGTGSWGVSPDNWIYGSVAGGDAHKGSEAGDQSAIDLIATFRHDPTISFFDQKWRANYEGISRANAVLRVLETVEDMSEAEKVRAAGEARFLRGHYYFDLTKMFNRVPWIDENTADYNQPNDVQWARIEEDFLFAMNNLPETQPDVGRANRWAAASYLAKAYVYQQKWEEAKPLFDEIIMNGQTSTGLMYALVNRYKDNFDPAEQNNSESVFSIQMVANDGTGTVANANQGGMLNFPFGGPFRCCGFFQPSQDLVNSYRTEEGAPIIDRYNDIKVTSDQDIESNEVFVPYQGSLDPRLDWTVGRRGIPYHDWGPFPGKQWIRNQQYAGPYHGKKHIWWRATEDQFYDGNSWAPGTAINYVVIRFADVLLMAAEVEVELGNLDAARGLVNRVRERAQNPDGFVANELNSAFAHAVVDNEAAMLASGASPGSWVVRTDRNSTFVLLDGSADNINNWQEYEDPASNYEIASYAPGHPNFQSQASAREAVHMERKLELAMEGHRFFDLVRWGEGVEKLNEYFSYEGALYPDVRGGSFTPGKNEYYPIPQRQIDLSAAGGEPVLTQNPGY